MEAAAVLPVIVEPTEIRVATLNDMPYMIALAQESYPNRGIERGIPWMEWALKSPERLVLVGPGCAGVAQVSWNYGFERRARLDMLAGRSHWSTFKMVRYMLAWAKSMGATGTFRLDADTGVDFAPFAKRLGGRPVTLTRYEIPLEVADV